MAPPQKERNILLATVLHIGIRVRYYLTNWLGFKGVLTPISAYPSPWRPKNCPHYDFLTQSLFFFCWFFTAWSREFAGILYFIFCHTGVMWLVGKLHDWTANRLINQMKAQGYTSAQRKMPIPEYDWRNGDPETFFKTFAVRPHPVVLRGFMKDTELLKKLSWDTVLSKYGEEEVYLTTRQIDGTPGKLKEVNNPKVYLHNSEKLFNKFPEIRDLFQYERLEPYLHMKTGYEQLFVGREGTGTPFHNAANWNMFYMIDGQKDWFFVDPYDTFLGYPVCLLGRAAGVLMCLWPDNFNREAFPLFDYCPVYHTRLNAGDVLFNPPWWWHSIKNVTPTSVGVASRWHTDGIAGHNLTMTEEDYNVNRIFSLFFFAGWSGVPFLQGILRTPSPRYDEHLTLRETKNRFVHRQMDMHDEGGIKLNGITTKF
mmetsp:Transcript_14105/g.24841  ORF Transcript_14105/g.24841 Transcript_14105/m.24841 type:complete len:426 (-) Transcript_14105:500-1777(-)